MTKETLSRLPAGMGSASSESSEIRRDASHVFTVDGPVERVFGLFDPVSECDWVDDWQPVAVYPAELGRSEGTVFTIERDGRTAVWTVLRYSADQHVAEYLVCEHGYQHRWIYVSCSAESTMTTKVLLRYVTTPLSLDGLKDIGRYGEDFLRAWEAPVRTAIESMAA